MKVIKGCVSVVELFKGREPVASDIEKTGMSQFYTVSEWRANNTLRKI